MNWWKKALIATLILLAVDAGFALAMHQHIQKTAESTQAADIRDDKLGGLCGQILGFGTGMIWIVAYMAGKKRRAS